MTAVIPLIGILALQGGVAEHHRMLLEVGADVREVRTLEALSGLNGLIMPGGESTAIGRLIDKNGLRDTLRTAIENGLPVWGTCAGAILLAKAGSEFSLGVLDIDVERNAYGAQLESFVSNLDIRGIDHPFPAVFIRAPRFIRTGEKVEILATHKNEPVLVRQNHLWAGSFHPELSDDAAVHRLFAEFCAGRQK